MLDSPCLVPQLSRFLQRRGATYFLQWLRAPKRAKAEVARFLTPLACDQKGATCACSVGQSKPQASQIQGERKQTRLWMERSSMCETMGGFKQGNYARHVIDK